MPIIFGSKEALEQRYRDALSETELCPECGAVPLKHNRCNDCNGDGYIIDADEDGDVNYEDLDECDVCAGYGYTYFCSGCYSRIKAQIQETRENDVKRKFGKLEDKRKAAARYIAAEETAARA